MSLGYRSQPGQIVPRQLSCRALVLTLLLSMVVTQICFAQKGASGRKVITRVEPAYPLILKVKHIEGQVRLRVVVLASGSVAAIEVRGGNPILVENSIAAVKSWKYAPAPEQTDEEIVLYFNAR